MPCLVPRPAVGDGRQFPAVDAGEYAPVPVSWLAEDYVQLGEIDHAADMATRMAILAGRTNSARTDTRLRFLAGRLEPYRANTGVADFFDAYRAAAVPHPREPE